jgi:hypothetical protein
LINLVKKNLLVQYQTNGTLYGSEDHLVWASSDQGQTWSEICRLAGGQTKFSALLKNYVLRSALVRRWRRNIGISNVVVLPSGTVIAQYDKIYRYDGLGRHALPVYDLAHNRIAAPLKNGLCYDAHTDALYFGEYICSRPNAIRIIRGTNDGRDWDICYTFPLGQIRHVHSIISDPYRKRLWICTGDADRESALYYTDDGFATINWFGGGDQSWRMVSLLPQEDCLLWGSDAGGDAPPATANFIYRFDFRLNKREQVVESGNPFYYSMQTAEGLCMATTYEPHKIGLSSPCVELFFSRDGVSWQSLVRLSYKRQSTQGTSYGMVIFPQGQTKGFLFTPINTESSHFNAFSLNKKEL